MKPLGRGRTTWVFEANDILSIVLGATKDKKIEDVVR